MRTLSKILAASTIFVNSLIPTYADLKEDSKELGKVVLKNALRKENIFPTFEIPQENKINATQKVIFKDNVGEIKSKTNEIEYSLVQKGKEIYFSIAPKEFERMDWRESKNEKMPLSHKYSRINESTMLIALYSKDATLKDFAQQGYFAKINPWDISKTSVTKKGMIPLDVHEEAKKCLEIGESMIKNIGEKIPFFDEAYPIFLEYNQEKAKNDLKKIGESFGNQYNLTLIPTNIPDKLTGQTLTRLDYLIKFDRPTKVILYSITNFGNPADINNLTGAAAEGFCQTRQIIQTNNLENLTQIPPTLFEKNGDIITFKNALYMNDYFPITSEKAVNEFKKEMAKGTKLSREIEVFKKDGILFERDKGLTEEHPFEGAALYEGKIEYTPSDLPGYQNKLKMKGTFYLLLDDFTGKRMHKKVDKPVTMELGKDIPEFLGQNKRTKFKQTLPNEIFPSQFKEIYFGKSEHEETIYIK